VLYALLLTWIVFDVLYWGNVWWLHELLAAFAISVWTFLDLHYCSVERYAAFLALKEPKNLGKPISWLSSDSEKPPLDQDVQKKFDEI
jgi:hypothetical protein